MTVLKQVFLHASKCLGLFAFARRLTRAKLRVLCYHGFSLVDEDRFRPGLFIDLATFRKRLQYLARHSYSVLRLEAALDSLEKRAIPPCPTVITIDDGFYSTYAGALGLLREFGFPATVYLASYYCIHRNPVFRLVVQYMFWKTEARQLDPGGLPLASTPCVPLNRDDEQDRIMWEIIDHGERAGSEAERCDLARELGKRLGVDYDRMVESRILSLVSPEEARRLLAGGVDLQLHTHRHRFPMEEELASREIQDNRAVLEPLAGRPLNHFCYPSGIWSRRRWPLLAKLGIHSAATCDVGFNDATTPKLALKRFLDGSNISQIEFEAEMAGFKELLRFIASALRLRMR